MTVAQRKVVSDGSQMNVRTNRLGLLSIHATAPVIDGEVSESALNFTVRIDQVVTGNPLLDPELHALIREITRGILTYPDSVTATRSTVRPRPAASSSPSL